MRGEVAQLEVIHREPRARVHQQRHVAELIGEPLLLARDLDPNRRRHHAVQHARCRVHHLEKLGRFGDAPRKVDSCEGELEIARPLGGD